MRWGCARHRGNNAIVPLRPNSLKVTDIERKQPIYFGYVGNSRDDRIVNIAADDSQLFAVFDELNIFVATQANNLKAGNDICL